MWRKDIVLSFCVDKHVLDCGGVDHQDFKKKNAVGIWLHEEIRKVAKSVTGVDILEENVQEINQDGRYHFSVQNVENMQFNDRFEVVVAGELVEHIYNMGAFLDSAWNCLLEDGVLVITTPNQFGFSYVVRSWLFGKEKAHPEHTAVYSEQTLTRIVSKHGFRVRRVHHLDRPASNRFLQFVRSTLVNIRPIMGDSLVVVAEKLPEQAKYDDMW